MIRLLTRACVISGLLLTIAGPARLYAQGADIPRVGLANVSDGQLVTPGRALYAAVRPDSAGVEFTFRPEGTGDVFVAPIALGTDFGHMEPAYGPDCENGCEKKVFSIVPDKVLGNRGEGWGSLTMREIGTGAEASARVYWDPTPPVSRFVTPAFNGKRDANRRYEVVTHTLDEDVISVKLKWALAPLVSSAIPRFEQHNLGYDFAMHAACVPTSVGASLRGVHSALQNVLVPPFDTDDKALVETLGNLMNTDSGGTSGSELAAGLKAFLLITKGWSAGTDYDLLNIGPDDKMLGITPEQLFAAFHVYGGAIVVGLHNLASEPKFGHILSLADVVMNGDGSAQVTLMDPHVEQPWPSSDPITTGVFRSFKLHISGKLEWTDGNPGYYTPSSGQVVLDELHVITNFPSLTPVNLATATAALSGTAVSGEVEGVLTPGGRTFVGAFTPPADSPGPWILTAETTHRAGHTMRSYRVVGVN